MKKYFFLFVNMFIMINLMQCQTISNQQLIQNGDFNDNNCKNDYCLQSSVYKNNFVRGWIASPILQTGYSKTFLNNSTSLSKVMFLKYGSCIQQTIPRVSNGNMNLTVRWALKNMVLSGDISFYYNLVLISTLKTDVYKINSNSFIITKQNGCQLDTIRICGSNIVVISVSLIGNKIITPVINVPNQNLSGFSNPLTTINSMTPDCIQKTFMFDQDFYQLKLAYKAFRLSSLMKSHMIIYWNNKLLDIRIPDDQSQHILTFQVKATQGINYLKFCPSVCSQESIYHQIQIDNSISLTKKSCLGTKYTNIIKNSGFQIHTCKQITCLNTVATFSNINLINWQIQRIIQLGDAPYYGQIFPKTRIVQLYVYVGQCIKQSISLLQNGSYVLQIDYKARIPQPLQYNQFNVTIGDLIIQNIFTPSDYSFQTNYFYFNLSQKVYNKYLKICGNPRNLVHANSDIGIGIDNIELYYLGGCK